MKRKESMSNWKMKAHIFGFLIILLEISEVIAPPADGNKPIKTDDSMSVLEAVKKFREKVENLINSAEFEINLKGWYDNMVTWFKSKPPLVKEREKERNARKRKVEGSLDSMGFGDVEEVAMNIDKAEEKNLEDEPPSCDIPNYPDILKSEVDNDGNADGDGLSEDLDDNLVEEVVVNFGEEIKNEASEEHTKPQQTDEIIASVKDHQESTTVSLVGKNEIAEVRNDEKQKELENLEENIDKMKKNVVVTEGPNNEAQEEDKEDEEKEEDNAADNIATWKNFPVTSGLTISAVISNEGVNENNVETDMLNQPTQEIPRNVEDDSKETEQDILSTKEENSSKANDESNIKHETLKVLERLEQLAKENPDSIRHLFDIEDNIEELKADGVFEDDIPQDHNDQIKKEESKNDGIETEGRATEGIESAIGGTKDETKKVGSTPEETAKSEDKKDKKKKKKEGKTKNKSIKDMYAKKDEAKSKIRKKEKKVKEDL